MEDWRSEGWRTGGVRTAVRDGGFED